MAFPTADTFTNLTGEVPQPSHPYYPLSASIPNYTPNITPVPILLTVFFSACAALFTTTYFLVHHFNPKLTRGELTTVMWFVLSGAIHIVFEGHYVANFATLGGSQAWIGQMWKEYAHSDSRYLTRNAQVLCLEGVTAVVWGPACLVIAVFVVRRSPWRWAAQVLVSMGQLYGDALYFATCFFDHIVEGVTYSRPEAFYFWFYFVLMNSFWIVIPGYLIYQGVVHTSRAVAVVQRLDSSKKAE